MWESFPQSGIFLQIYQKMERVDYFLGTFHRTREEVATSLSEGPSYRCILIIIICFGTVWCPLNSDTVCNAPTIINYLIYQKISPSKNWISSVVITLLRIKWTHTKCAFMAVHILCVVSLRKTLLGSVR